MERSPLEYAFAHLVAGYANPEDAHSADSIGLGRDTLNGIEELSANTISQIEALAEYVAGNYEYTGQLNQSRADAEKFLADMQDL